MGQVKQSAQLKRMASIREGKHKNGLAGSRGFLGVFLCVLAWWECHQQRGHWRDEQFLREITPSWCLTWHEEEEERPCVGVCKTAGSCPAATTTHAPQHASLLSFSLVGTAFDCICAPRPCGMPHVPKRKTSPCSVRTLFLDLRCTCLSCSLHTVAWRHPHTKMAL